MSSICWAILQLRHLIATVPQSMWLTWNMIIATQDDDEPVAELVCRKRQVSRIDIGLPGCHPIGTGRFERRSNRNQEKEWTRVEPGRLSFDIDVTTRGRHRIRIRATMSDVWLPFFRGLFGRWCSRHRHRLHDDPWWFIDSFRLRLIT